MQIAKLACRSPALQSHMFSTQLSTVPHPQLGKPCTSPPRLLVSVRSASEATLAKSLGVEWIDLKNPDAGSLGAADALVAQEVAKVLKLESSSPVQLSSAAAGELGHDPLVAGLMLSRYFPLVKVGLAELAGTMDWQTKLRTFSQQLSGAGSQIVPVIYADYRHCSAPSPQDVLSAAASLEPSCNLVSSKARYILVDTHTKDGRRLLDCLTQAELASIVQDAVMIGRQVVLAGSLALSDLPSLLKLPVAAIAVRGAVCEGDRRSELSPRKVRQWLELVQKQ